MYVSAWISGYTAQFPSGVWRTSRAHWRRPYGQPRDHTTKHGWHIAFPPEPASWIQRRRPRAALFCYPSCPSPSHVPCAVNSPHSTRTLVAPSHPGGACRLTHLRAYGCHAYGCHAYGWAGWAGWAGHTICVRYTPPPPPPPFWRSVGRVMSYHGVGPEGAYATSSPPPPQVTHTPWQCPPGSPN